MKKIKMVDLLKQRGFDDAVVKVKSFKVPIKNKPKYCKFHVVNSFEDNKCKSNIIFKKPYTVSTSTDGSYSFKCDKCGLTFVVHRNTDMSI